MGGVRAPSYKDDARIYELKIGFYCILRYTGTDNSDSKH